MTISYITPADDADMAAIIRHSLKDHHLDIPGTAYFDPELDHLSTFYGAKPKSRSYFVVKDETGKVIGGIGLAEFPQIPDTCELQKLYLADEAKKKGLGRALVERIFWEAEGKGYQKIYLETHSSLVAAIALYEKLGFTELERPEWVFHSAMDHFYMKNLQQRTLSGCQIEITGLQQTDGT